MKYKNYKNSYTKEDKIYSRENMLDMSLREMITRKGELLAQREVLGIPEEEELRNSENAVYVEAYTRDDGTEVKAHWRSKPNCGENNNSNVQLKNTDWDDNIEDSDEFYNSQNIEETVEYKLKYKEAEIRKSIERKDPDKIAGVKRSQPMNFHDANNGKVNPYYINEPGYDSNCASCVYAYELRRRGYDVEAVPVYDGNAGEELSKHVFDSWLDPENNTPCEWYEIDIKIENCYDFLSNNIKFGERYALINYYDSNFDGDVNVNAHIFVAEKDEKGDVFLYDPQSSTVRKNDLAIDYIKTWMGKDAQYNPKYLRIDNKKLSPKYRDNVVASSSH